MSYPMSGWHTPWMLDCIDNTLKGNCKMRIRLQFIRPVFIDAQHIREDVIKTITVYDSNILEGSVSIEATTTAPTRQLEVSFLDENDEYDLSNAGGYTLINPEMMIQVYYEIHVPEFAPENGGYVWFPIFRGHISRADKRGTEVKISALSKDARYMEPCIHSPLLGQNKQLWKGLLLTDAIRYMLGVKGEQMYRMPNFPERLRNDVIVKWDDVPWAVCQKLAYAHGMSLYFDGLGMCTLRRNDWGTIDYEIDGQMLTDFPDRNLDFTQLINVVVFLGYKPEKGTQIRAVARNQNNPLDQQYIKQWKVEVVENSNVKQQSMAQELANRVLTEKQQATFTIGISSLVIPHLEEYDMIRVRDPIRYGLPGYPSGGEINDFKIGQMNIPLDNKTPMTINKEYPFSYKLKSYYKKGRNPYR